MASDARQGGRSPAGRPPGGSARVRTPLQRILYWLSVTAIWGMIFVVTLMFVLAIGLPDTSRLYSTTAQPTVSYLDRSGIQLAVRGSRYAPPVDIDKLPKYVPDAFVAIEDQQFYHHFGFNPWGILRSQIYNVRHAGQGVPLRGGSTITQQLARYLFLTNKQTYARKIQELELAIILEIKYSKKQILGLYLNRMDFGSGAYGIEAASQRYFNTSADRLSLGQAALLAGMLKGPSRYSPIANGERAGRRAAVVLDVMVKTHKITAAERDFELRRLHEAAEIAAEAGLRVTAGHGLDYRYVRPICQIPNMEEISIGHAIIARAVFVGMDQAVREMIAAMRG